MTSRRWLAGAFAAVLLTTGCVEDPGRAGTGPPDVALPSVQQARAALHQLPLSARSPGGPVYERDAFGEAWADVDANGCNQRDDVLLRDAVPGTVRVQQQGSCGHDVLAGTWVDPYTGARLTFDDLKDLSQAQALQIDHVVPLAEAWDSGASAWRAARRERFANDARGLVAADGPTNGSKGSSDPAAWRPRQRFQCDYARRWIGVKQRWDLSVDTAERVALEQLLDTCRA